MIEDKKKTPRSTAVADQKAVGISRSELLSLLDAFHEKMDASFEEIRILRTLGVCKRRPLWGRSSREDLDH